VTQQKIVAAFVPLVDSAVLIAARDKGFMRQQDIELTLVREASWASLRDHLNLGHVDCAHALAPLPIAATLGGAPGTSTASASASRGTTSRSTRGWATSS
jgi:two-component system, oxyanion-binding sensor